MGNLFPGSVYQQPAGACDAACQQAQQDLIAAAITMLGYMFWSTFFP